MLMYQKTIFGLDLVAVGYQVGEGEEPTEELEEQRNPKQGNLF